MAALVVGEDALLLVGDDAPLLQAGDDTLERVVEVLHRELVAAAAPGADRGLVADVRQVGAGQARGLPRDAVEVDVVGERLAARVHEENLLAALEVGRLDQDLPVEPAGAQQRLVEILQAVRRAP